MCACVSVCAWALVCVYVEARDEINMSGQRTRISCHKNRETARNSKLEKSTRLWTINPISVCSGDDLRCDEGTWVTNAQSKFFAVLLFGIAQHGLRGNRTDYSCATNS